MSEKWCDPGLRAAWRSSGGGLITRGFAIVCSLGTLISLVIALAANSSTVLPAETSDVNNISVDISILGGTVLQRSVNVFGGVFVGLTAIGLIHSIVWMILMFLNIRYIRNKWCYISRILMAIDAISMFAHIGVITGAYYIGSLLGAYVELDPDPAISTAHTGVWIAFGFSIICIAQFFGLVLTACATQHYSNEKCNKKKCGGENQVDNDEKSDKNLF